MSIQIDQQISAILPFLRTASKAFLNEFSKVATRQRVPAEKILYLEGDRCTLLPIVLSGQLRVFKMGENGSEITLYRFGQGESCILTTSCIFSKGKFPAMAKVETEAEVLLVPASTVRDWMQRFPEWQGYLCALFGKRLADTIALVEEVTFKGMDARLVHFLLEHTNSEHKQIDLTHQEIAFELGTAREVISRLLKDLEMKNLISLSRGHITIKDLSGLKQSLKNKQM